MPRHKTEMLHSFCSVGCEDVGAEWKHSCSTTLSTVNGVNLTRSFSLEGELVFYEKINVGGGPKEWGMMSPGEASGDGAYGAWDGDGD